MQQHSEYSRNDHANIDVDTQRYKVCSPRPSELWGMHYHMNFDWTIKEIYWNSGFSNAYFILSLLSFDLVLNADSNNIEFQLLTS